MRIRKYIRILLTENSLAIANTRSLALALIEAIPNFPILPPKAQNRGLVFLIFPRLGQRPDMPEIPSVRPSLIFHFSFFPRDDERATINAVSARVIFFATLFQFRLSATINNGGNLFAEHTKSKSVDRGDGLVVLIFIPNHR